MAENKRYRSTGTVRWWNKTMGYGFITINGEEDIFVHYSGIKGEGKRELKEDQTVTFFLASTEKGDRATEVEIVKKQLLEQ